MLKVLLLYTALLSKALENDALESEVERINSVQKYWTAAENQITKRGTNYIKQLLGAKQSNEKLPVKENHYNTSVQDGLPDAFDARVKWPNCPSVSSIKDQSHCGSCWAIATTSCMSDRICIHSNGKIKVNLSTQNLLSCCSDCVDPQTSGCDGGYTSKAYLHYQNNGLVTGGDYNSNEGCQPYEIGGSRRKSNLYTPPCVKKCTNKSYKIPYRQDKHYGKTSYSLPKNVAKIQADIMEYGPVTATYDVYSDFSYYKSGVYVKTSSKKIQPHSVKILGWGVERGILYWLVANSWGREWGDKGTFKIRRGTDECGIESQVNAGLPKL